MILMLKTPISVELLNWAICLDFRTSVEAGGRGATETSPAEALGMALPALACGMESAEKI